MHTSNEREYMAHYRCELHISTPNDPEGSPLLHRYDCFKTRSTLQHAGGDWFTRHSEVSPTRQSLQK